MHFKSTLVLLSTVALAVSSAHAAAVSSRQEETLPWTVACTYTVTTQREFWELDLLSEFGWLSLIPLLRQTTNGNSKGAEIIEVDDEAKRGKFRNPGIWVANFTEDVARAFLRDLKGKSETTFSNTTWVFEDVVCED
ncbi:hypothetical protein DFP72DRAFT_868106 [Ephemerocybe angulata]|uniref:Uncharacterized protein n=1 Tax=Ephemerocybe angulata TaxID=980116 RepID=A0A8H6MDQ9_9AGAR|nr:hypothetical protein DFP72DRAFT_868106 [Tulosesus angulatus]